jgi:hypothetical protein
MTRFYSVSFCYWHRRKYLAIPLGGGDDILMNVVCVSELQNSLCAARRFHIMTGKEFSAESKESRASESKPPLTNIEHVLVQSGEQALTLPSFQFG